MDVPRQVRIVLATVFVGGLLATLVAGLIWAYTPAGSGGLTFRPDEVPRERPGDASPTPEDPDEANAAGGEEPAASPEATGAADGGSDEGGQDDEADEQLIAGAAEPDQTTVQVLDAGGGSSATQAAARLLRGLGYNVTNVTSARVQVERTTVWFTSGNEPEGLALRARDRRFAEVTANQGLNEATNLHALVGADWPD